MDDPQMELNTEKLATEKLKVINLYAGPGAGKSTVAAEVFAILKRRGLCAELVTEYAKDLTWDGRQSILHDSPEYIAAKQIQRLRRLVGKVDVVVTDSPLLLGLAYIENSGLGYRVVDLLKSANTLFDGLDVFLTRTKPYEPRGRNQTHAEAVQLDVKILDIVRRYTSEPRFAVDNSDIAAFLAEMALFKWPTLGKGNA